MTKTCEEKQSQCSLGFVFFSSCSTSEFVDTVAVQWEYSDKIFLLALVLIVENRLQSLVLIVMSRDLEVSLLHLVGSKYLLHA